MFILDTNVLSELRRPEKADQGVRAWADSVPGESFFLSAITILEIEIGTLRLLRRDPATAAMLRSWIDTRVLPGFAGRILPIDTSVALRSASLHVPDPRPERDAFIAATALVHGLTVATRNVGDFAATGVQTFNPWLAPPEVTR